MNNDIFSTQKTVQNVKQGNNQQTIGTGQVLTGRMPLYNTPDKNSMQVSQLLFGEHYDLYNNCEGNGEIEGSVTDSNWHLVQSKRDNYIGYLYNPKITTPYFEGNAKVCRLSTALYAAPNLKSPVLHELPFGAELYLIKDNSLNGSSSQSNNNPNSEQHHNDYYFSPPLQAWVYKGHVVFNDQPYADPVTLARQFIGLSYLWGGRSGWGCDCSSLVQLCYELCGCLLPRDSSQQVQYVNAFEKKEITRATIRSGDLLFWPGHVAMASSPSTLIHATAFGMQVIEEPIDQVCERIYTDHKTTSTILRPICPVS